MTRFLLPAALAAALASSAANVSAQEPGRYSASFVQALANAADPDRPEPAMGRSTAWFELRVAAEHKPVLVLSKVAPLGAKLARMDAGSRGNYFDAMNAALDFAGTGPSSVADPALPALLRAVAEDAAQPAALRAKAKTLLAKLSGAKAAASLAPLAAAVGA